MSNRHPVRIAVYVEGKTYYPRELAEVGGKLYIIDEDGSARILNNYKITLITDADGNKVGSVDPGKEATIALPDASESKKGLVKLSYETPKPPASIPSAGVSTDVARGDHTHQAQTDIEGNAKTASQFKEEQSIEIIGDVTGSAKSRGGWSISTLLKQSGVISGQYGKNDITKLDGDGTIIIPLFKVDEKGRIIEAIDQKINVSAASAYDIAVKYGFEGSEEEWLASLVGPSYTLSDEDKQEIAKIALDDFVNVSETYINVSEVGA